MKSSLNLLCIVARFYGPLQNYASQFGAAGAGRGCRPSIHHSVVASIVVSWSNQTPRTGCRLLRCSLSAVARSLIQIPTSITQEVHSFASHRDYAAIQYLSPRAAALRRGVAGVDPKWAVAFRHGNPLEHYYHPLNSSLARSPGLVWYSEYHCTKWKSKNRTENQTKPVYCVRSVDGLVLLISTVCPNGSVLFARVHVVIFSRALHQFPQPSSYLQVVDDDEKGSGNSFRTNKMQIE